MSSFSLFFSKLIGVGGNTLIMLQIAIYYIRQNLGLVRNLNPNIISTPSSAKIISTNSSSLGNFISSFNMYKNIYIYQLFFKKYCIIQDIQYISFERA